MNLLLLAVDLSMLTYVIGVLILALPIPIKSVKRWGPRLISDGVLAAILASSSSLILTLGDKLLRIIGVDWPSFYAWLSARTAAIGGIFAGLMYGSSLLKTTEYMFLSSPLRMAASFLATAFSAIRAIFLISSFIYVYRYKLTAIGILLYSLPFRIGKGVGAFLIASSLILYVGLPLMPAFVSEFEGVTSSIGGSAQVIRINVTDAVGNPVPYPIIKFYSRSSCTEQPAGIIIGDRHGRAAIGGGKDILPSRFKLYVRVSFMGYSIVPVPDSVSSDNNSVKLVLRSLIYSSGLSLLIPWSTDILYYNVGKGRISIDLFNNNPEVIHVVRLSNTSIISLNIDGRIVRVNSSVRKWGGMTLFDSALRLNSGRHNVTVIFTQSPYPRPRVSEYRIVYLSSIFDVITGVLTLCISFLYTLVLLPGVYLAMLLAMSAALARVLGGGLRIRLV